MIKHYSIFGDELSKVIEHYSNKDNVPVKYVCTTDLVESDLFIDVFYRSTPHPQYGNKYFGLYFRGDDLMICNADMVEELFFGLVENDDNDLEYSETHHSYKSFDNGNMIDGGRTYIRSSGKVTNYVVRNGEMIPSEYDAAWGNGGNDLVMYRG